jgi:exopolysaccharide biosynthesis polyprenyl glycosylphosphotransferase
MSEQAVTASPPVGAVTDASLERHSVTSGARSRSRRAATWALGRGLSDVMALAIAALTVAGSEAGLTDGWHAATAVVTLIAFGAGGAYASPLRSPASEEMRRVLVSSAVAAISMSAAVLLLADRSADGIVLQWAVATALVSAGRLAFHGLGQLRIARPETAGRTLIVGAGRVGHLTAKRMLEDRALGMVPVGFLDKNPLLGGEQRVFGERRSLPVLGASWDLERVVHEQDIDHVVVAFSTAPHHVVLGLVRSCWKLGVNVLVVPRLYEVEGRRHEVEHLGALPLIRLRDGEGVGWQLAVKYAIDRVVAGLALVAVAPLFAAVTLAVLLTMGRPVLFRQRRIGRDGVEFDMLKFRTMRGTPNVDGEADATWASLILNGGPMAVEPAADDRRTPVGEFLRRLSLDELPQLWNVVRGDMSLVGPRPERAHYAERFADAIYRYPDRHRVKSGLTGWAQIHGLRGETSLADRVEWDNYYIEHWSPRLDLQILLRTLPALFARRTDDS